MLSSGPGAGKKSPGTSLPVLSGSAWCRPLAKSDGEPEGKGQLSKSQNGAGRADVGQRTVLGR